MRAKSREDTKQVCCFQCGGDVSRWCGHCHRTGVEPASEVLAQALVILALRTLRLR